MSDTKRVRLNIEKILEDKNPRLKRWIPSFVIKWIEKLLEVKKHNEILEIYENRPPIEFIDGALDYVGVKYSLHNTHNVPKDDKVLFAANHPLGGIDGMILATAIEKIKPNVKLIVNDILLNIEPLKPIFVGVNKHGAQATQLSLKLDELYNSQSPIINFPAGMCSRLTKKRGIEDLKWKHSFVSKCMVTNRVVVPTYVKAQNSMFFYKFAKWREKLGVKINLEMVLLSREIFLQKGKEVKIYFGEPIELNNSKSTRQWSEYIREQVYKMKTENN